MSTQPQQEQALILAGRTSPLIIELSERWKMTPQSMIDTLKATVFPQKDRNDKPIVVSNAQLLMFLQVCREYSLNPYIKEIYAFPTKGGGIVPMVPIDGWSNIINRSPQMDGLEFVDEWELDVNGARKGRIPFSTTCIIYRKDRSRPIKVTEYFHECVQPNKEPWTKWPSRMLRWKAMIQCARVAFSLGGIYDPDEAERIAETGDKPEPAKPGRASAVIEGSEVRSNASAPTAQQTAAEVHAPAAEKSEAHPLSQPQSKGEAPSAQSSASPAPSGCICNCCKSGNCDCAGKDEMDQCGCSACLAAVKTPGPSASPSMEEVFSRPPVSQVTGEVMPSGKPAGPYVPQEKLKRLFIHAASAGITIVKDSHDDQLHQILKAKWNIESLKEIPVSLFEDVLAEIAPGLKAAKAAKKK
jgi:phage recombination protein Bet